MTDSRLGPASDGDVVATSAELLRNCTCVAATPPTITVAWSVNWLPRIVSVVPPNAGPVAGCTTVIVGAPLATGR